MPVAVCAQDPGTGFAPVLRLPFSLGSDPRSDFVDPSPGVAPTHARIRYVKGEYLLMAEGEAALFVGGARVPMLSLEDGDEVRLGPAGAPLVFRNRLQGCFRPPEASLTEAWLSLPGSADPALGSAGWGPGPGVGGRDPARCRRVETATGGAVVKRFGPARDARQGDAHLALLARLGGAAHPALAPLLDGGIERVDGRVERWAVTRWVEGHSLQHLIEAGGVPVAQALCLLRSLAAALAHLHARGVVHRDVAPGNGIQTGAGDAVLLDFGQAVLQEAEPRSSAGVVGTPGYIAPEEVLAGRAAVSPAVDVYGLGAIGYALLAGAPPSQGGDLLATLGGATRPPPALSELGLSVPALLEATLLQCLAPDPLHRQDAATVLAALESLDAPARLGDGA